MIGRVWREIEMNLNGQPGEEMHESFEGDELPPAVPAVHRHSHKGT